MIEIRFMKQQIKCLFTGLIILFLVACGKAEKETTDATPTQTKTSVAAETVKRDDVQTWVFGEGTARALKREFLSFESAGRIAFVDPNIKEGDIVKKGQMIAYQEKNHVVNKMAQPNALSHATVRDAAANLKLAEKSYNRFKKLLSQKSASLQEYDEAQAKYEQARVAYQNAAIVADESRIVSPIDGMVARLNIEQGYYFSPSQVQSTSEAGALNTVPVVIIDPSAFEITVSLPSFYYRQLSVGSNVMFHQGTNQNNPQSDRAKQIHGYVYAISPSVDPDTRTFAVKLRTTSGAQFLQDGEYLSAWIAGPISKDAITIPINSTRFENNKPYVFRLDINTNKVSKVYVTLGMEGRNKHQVLTGLSVGDQVITEGRSRLSDGDLVRIVDISNHSSGKSQ